MHIMSSLSKKKVLRVNQGCTVLLCVVLLFIDMQRLRHIDSCLKVSNSIQKVIFDAFIIDMKQLRCLIQ